MVHAPSTQGASQPGSAAQAPQHDDIFMKSFSAEERSQLLSEDRSAQLGISAILATLIAIGMFLGIFSVLLISYLGI